MNHATRNAPFRWLALGLVVAAAAAWACGVAVADDDEAPAPTLQKVEVYDGNDWKAVGLRTGSLEGPDGGTTAKALLKSELGGPKTYFVLGGAASETAVTLARPRFRVETDAATARRIQLAPLEVKDETRRTPIEIRKGLTLFKRGIELEATRVRDGLWELRPKRSLQPGEYVLALAADGPVADLTIAARGY
jgi:hypothetical protein